LTEEWSIASGRNPPSVRLSMVSECEEKGSKWHAPLGENAVGAWRTNS
jgi:hypothetical protein